MVRWILVLPVACISLYIVYGVIWVRTAHIPIPFFSYINEFMASQVAGFVFVYAGSYVAPCYKKISAVVLGFLFLLYSIYTIIDPYSLYSDVNILETIVYKIGGVLACVGAIVLVRESDDA